MDDQLTRIEDKIDKLDTRLDKVEIILAVQHGTLVEHTSRSTKLENIVIPMQAKMNMVEGALKFIGLVGVVAGIIDVIIHLFHS